MLGLDQAVNSAFSAYSWLHRSIPVQFQSKQYMPPGTEHAQILNVNEGPEDLALPDHQRPPGPAYHDFGAQTTVLDGRPVVVLRTELLTDAEGRVSQSASCFGAAAPAACAEFITVVNALSSQ